jgi:hypothetical protein
VVLLCEISWCEGYDTVLDYIMGKSAVCDG